jgi:hypothetical protein
VAQGERVPSTCTFIFWPSFAGAYPLLMLPIFGHFDQPSSVCVALITDGNATIKGLYRHSTGAQIAREYIAKPDSTNPLLGDFQ